jgi:hypothetical protein
MQGHQKQSLMDAKLAEQSRDQMNGCDTESPGVSAETHKNVAFGCGLRV